MGYRLKTSRETKDIFDELYARINLKPFALAKISIALSLLEEEPIEEVKEEDTEGLELNRQTIMGEKDIVFKSLMEKKSNRSLTEDEFYPEYSKKHLDRGAKLLKNMFEYSGNYQRLVESLIIGRKNI